MYGQNRRCFEEGFELGGDAILREYGSKAQRFVEKCRGNHAVDVGGSESKPVLAFGRVFMRVGKSNQKLEYGGIRSLALQTSKVYYDWRGCDGASLDNIDGEKVRLFLRRVMYERKLELDLNTPVRESL